MKDATKEKKIERLGVPDLLVLPMLEKYGISMHPVVEAGDKVEKWQLVAESYEGPSYKVHSPVSGIVEKIEKSIQIDGSNTLSVFIKNDGLYAESPTGESQMDLGARNIFDIIEQAGIVGVGGAQFPTASKYDLKGKKVDTFIINGAECEPFLTCDYVLMRDRTADLLEGILLVNEILDAGSIVIAFEYNSKELEEVFAPFLAEEKYRKISLHVLPDEYPQGSELQLIRTITGIEIEKGTVPLERGVVVSNVGTVCAVYDAVANKIPFVERVITVAGAQVGRPGNYSVAIGTTIEYIAKACEINTANTILVGGGPMMSPRVLDLDAPITKGTLGVVALPRVSVERHNCIWCGYCADVCPMRLMPMKYEQFYRRGSYTKLGNYDLTSCIECGACEYVCPCRVPLIESIKKGKIKLKEIQNAAR